MAEEEEGKRIKRNIWERGNKKEEWDEWIRGKEQTKVGRLKIG